MEGGSDDAPHVGAIDFDGNDSLLLSVGSDLGGLGLHFLQAGQEGFFFADGERGHFLRGSAGVIPR